MRLFHISEESNIEVFHPRVPSRNDIDKTKGLVWAITEECLPMFLTPRDCPRVAYHIGEQSSEEDIEKFFSNRDNKFVVVIEHDWFKIMKKITLYIYEFDTKNFNLQDSVAGYYVSKESEKPIKKYCITDLFDELFKRQVELRVVSNLWDMGNKIQNTTLDWSLCRMRNSKARLDK